MLAGRQVKREALLQSGVGSTEELSESLQNDGQANMKGTMQASHSCSQVLVTLKRSRDLCWIASGVGVAPPLRTYLKSPDITKKRPQTRHCALI